MGGGSEGSVDELMKISVNLATRPFVELRPLFARLRLAMGVLAVLAIGLGFGLHSLNQKAKAAQAKMDTLKSQTQAFERQRLANEARMRQPDNRGVLERSQFLNTLFAQKSFSWTAVMMDLEKVLPVGVQVTSLQPQVAKDGSVNMRLRVSGDRTKAVQLERNLETSQRFISPRLTGVSAQTEQQGRGTAMPVSSPGAVEFEILSNYNPLPEMPEKEKDKKATDDETARQTTKPAVKKLSGPPMVKSQPPKRQGAAGRLGGVQ
jgi:type IV pilus assembly protein PilN